MNEDIIKGKWAQLKGHIQHQWGELTNDDIDKINGDASIMAGLIQERYGKSKDDVEQEINAWKACHEDIV